MTVLRVVVAPDSFKGSVTAAAAAAAIAEGWRSVRPSDDVVELPQADGGEGTLDAIESATPGSVRRSAGMVTGPDGQPVPGEWLQLPDGTAVVELAQMSGIGLMTELRPLEATTRGLGETIGTALDAGARSLILGLGGSASTDGGLGALSALGLGVLDDAGSPVPDGGGSLHRVARIARPALRPAPFDGVRLLTDVNAPLLGPGGAAAVFGPQKGATPEQVALLEAGLAHLAGLLGGHPDAAGAGAAGGTGYGFMAAWGAQAGPGARHVAQLTGFANEAIVADVVLTGEGRYDGQSTMGKVVGTARKLTRDARFGVIAGQLAARPDGWAVGLDALAGSVDAALADPLGALHAAGAQAALALS